MNITLRKANSLQNSINDQIKSITIADAVNINEFQDAEAVILAKAQESMLTHERRVELTNALYSIRSAVAQANANSGVDQRLTEVARLDKIIGYNQEMAKMTVRTEASVISGKLEKIRNRKEDSRMSIYGHSDEVQTGLLSEETVAQFKAAVLKLKKTKQKLQDEILELNVRTEIQLNSQVVAVLTQEGLL